VPNCKFVLVTEAESKHVRRRAPFQQYRDPDCHEVIFFLQGKAPKEIITILIETLAEHAPFMALSKTGWPSLNMVIFPPVMCLVQDNPKQ